MTMNFKSIKAEKTTETRDSHELEKSGTGNLFETIVVLSKRSNQLAVEMNKNSTPSWKSSSPPRIHWKKCSKIANKSRFQNFMSVSRSPTAWPWQKWEKDSSESTRKKRLKKNPKETKIEHLAELICRHVATQKNLTGSHWEHCGL